MSVTKPHKTRHERPGRPVPLVELEGDHLWEVTVTASDGQTATGIVAADDAWKARGDFMFVQTVLFLRGQYVTYQVRQLSENSPRERPLGREHEDA